MMVEKVIEEVKPDVMVCDQLLTVPSVEKSGIPWVLVCSCNPLIGIKDERTPPGNSGEGRYELCVGLMSQLLGLPTIGHDKEWRDFRRLTTEANSNNWNLFNEYLRTRGVESLKTQHLINPSPYLNIYPFTRELDYTDIRPLAKKWVQFDNLMRFDHQDQFVIPERLLSKSGKLIFFFQWGLWGRRMWT